jgi:hypothetical protein
MHVIPQTWCQIQRTTSSFRYVNSDPGHIQSIYSSAHSVLQYSTERICAPIADMTTIQCMLYYKPGAKYNGHPPVYSIWTVAPDIYNGITVLQIRPSIFNWTYLRWYWRCVDNSMRLVLETLCQIQRTSSSLHYRKLVPGICNVVSALHIQDSIFNYTYLRWYWRYIDNSMGAILQTWCQIQRASSSLLCLNCGSGHIQWNYRSAYSALNIQLNVSALILEMCRQFNAPCTANFVPNTAHILQITLCEMLSRPYTMYLHLRILRLQYSTERICAAIGDISTIQCAVYCKHGAKYSAHLPDYAIWTVVPDIYNELTATHILVSIFKWTNPRCYWRYVDNSMRHILQTLCQIQRTSSRLRYMYCGPGHIQWTYSSTYSGYNIQMNVYALLLEICRQFSDRYTANMVPNAAHILQFTLSELWSRTYTMNLQLHIFRLQYSTERTSAANRDMTRIQCALYCKLRAKYSAHPPDYAICIVVPAIYSVITAPHTQASLFNWAYLRCHWGYIDNSMCVILQTWYQIQRT